VQRCQEYDTLIQSRHRVIVCIHIVRKGDKSVVTTTTTTTTAAAAAAAIVPIFYKSEEKPDHYMICGANG